MVAQILECISKEYLKAHWIHRDWVPTIEALIDETIGWSASESAAIAEEQRPRWSRGWSAAVEWRAISPICCSSAEDQDDAAGVGVVVIPGTPCATPPTTEHPPFACQLGGGRLLLFSCAAHSIAPGVPAVKRTPPRHHS
jgi:hypothetical protein